jgi:hypothetical protein
MTSTKQIYPEKHQKWLSDDEYLWRYVPLRTLFFYLAGNIFIPSVEKLRQADPFEGNFPVDSSWFNSAIERHYGSNEGNLDEWLYQRRCNENERKLMDLNKGQEAFANRKADILMTHYFEFIRNTRNAWCWFLGSESAAMWSVYGNQGVAIATTVARIRQTFVKANRNATFGQMFYVEVCQGQVIGLNPGEPEHQQFILQPHFMKRKEYASEREVRFVGYGPENRKKGGIVLKGIDPNDWIQQIKFWPKLTSPEEAALSTAVKKAAPNIQCFKSDLLTSQDDSVYDENGVEAAMVETDEKSWGDNSDGIPSFLKRHEC